MKTLSEEVKINKINFASVRVLESRNLNDGIERAILHQKQVGQCLAILLQHCTIAV